MLHRAAEHLTYRWAGVFFPELVERCVTQAHTALAATARIPTELAPIAVHPAGNRLAVLARAKGSLSAPVRQVLFVDNRVQALWVEISTSSASTPPGQGPRF